MSVPIVCPPVEQFIVSLFEHLIKFLTCIYGQVKKKKKKHILTVKSGSEEQDADYEGHEQAVSDGVQPIQVSRLTHGSGHCSLSGKLSQSLNGNNVEFTRALCSWKRNYS